MDNLERVRALFGRFSQNELRAAFDRFDPDVVYHPREDEPDAHVRVGRASFEALIRGWYESFPTIWFDIVNLVEPHENVVICDTVLHARGGASGAEVNDHYTFVYELRDGLVVEGWEYRTLAEATASIDERVPRT